MIYNAAYVSILALFYCCHMRGRHGVLFGLLCTRWQRIIAPSLPACGHRWLQASLVVAHVMMAIGKDDQALHCQLASVGAREAAGMERHRLLPHCHPRDHLHTHHQMAATLAR